MLAILLLGIIQGLTEFLPVSSSGHLALFGALLGIGDRGLAVDVALHLGTLAAVIVVFRAELVGMAAAMLGRRPDPVLRRLGWLIGLATVPIVIAGLLLRSTVEELSASPRAVSLFLLVTAGSMLLGELLRRRRTHLDRAPRAPTPAAVGGRPLLPATDDPSDPSGRALDRLDPRHALGVGLAQCLALFPGVSRSGVTIAAGIASGMTRTAATRFSFLLSLPALVGAAALTLPDLAGQPDVDLTAVLVGVAASFVAGYAAIRILLALVARVGLYVFVVYCTLLAAVGLIVTA
ncbi:MAG: undecaprenyl-diphosphate phosphatase [Egibacteraceae bacterium]